MRDGVWFIEGHNGAGDSRELCLHDRSCSTCSTGKSTILEAVAWCQFNKFLRSDMLAEYAVNDAVGKNCSVPLHALLCSHLQSHVRACNSSRKVRLDFANGYSIERFRGHKEKGGSGVVVFKDGEKLEEMHKGENKDSQVD